MLVCRVAAAAVVAAAAALWIRVAGLVLLVGRVQSGVQEATNGINLVSRREVKCLESYGMNDGYNNLGKFKA